MSNPSELGQEVYVRAAHFVHSDDAALFGALAAVDRTVEMVIIEDPSNPLLRRHAEIRAEETIEAVNGVDQQFPNTKFAEMTRALFSGEGTKIRLIEDEILNLRSLMESPGMGVFAIYGTKENVISFIRAHLEQPDPKHIH